MLSRAGCFAERDPVEVFGLQLYSVRDLFEKDPANTVRQVAALGYKYLESYERNGDMFWGLGPKGFKSLADEVGIGLVSSHCEIEKDFERKVEQAAEAGLQYLVHNWPHADQPIEAYQQKCEEYNRCGELCQKAGLRFAQHNYSSSYRILDGIYPQELIMEKTDPELVFHQMDIYWIWRAGQDPVYWLNKFPGRYKMAHIKDGNNKETTLLGKGRLPLQKIIEAGQKQGMQHLIVEQEDYDDMSSMEAARRNARWMSSRQ